MKISRREIGIRWTIGDVSERGFETLRLSIWGAWKVFGPDAAYGVCVNHLSAQDARRRTGDVPEAVRWHDTMKELPAFVRQRLHANMAEGVGWKFAPLRQFPEHYEISLDNDCILWEMPSTMAQWLEAKDPGLCLMAEDVRACFGQFTEFCGPRPRNSGIRGLPPGFDLETALEEILRAKERREGKPVILASETDEQGLQVAALSQGRQLLAVTLEEVAVCSPFHPHLPELGRCGAHFVGMNARHIPWNYYGRPADEWMAAHWERHRPTLYRHAGLTMAARMPQSFCNC